MSVEVDIVILAAVQIIQAVCIIRLSKRVANLWEQLADLYTMMARSQRQMKTISSSLVSTRMGGGSKS